MSDVKELIELENVRCAGISAGDMEQIGRTLADDYLHAHNNGKITNKADTLALIASLGRRKVSRGDLAVRFYGEDFAVLTGPLTNTRSEDGLETVVQAYATQVAVRKGGEWKFVSYHASFVPADKVA